MLNLFLFTASISFWSAQKRARWREEKIGRSQKAIGR